MSASNTAAVRPLDNRLLNRCVSGINPRINSQASANTDVQIGFCGDKDTTVNSIEFKGALHLSVVERNSSHCGAPVTAHAVFKIVLARPPADQARWSCYTLRRMYR